MSEARGIWVKDGEIAAEHADGAVLYLPAATAPEPKAPLHSIKLVSSDANPYSTKILIDGEEPASTIESIKIEIGIEEANRATVVFNPEHIEIDGSFEGWAFPGSNPPGS